MRNASDIFNSYPVEVRESLHGLLLEYRIQECSFCKDYIINGGTRKIDERMAHLKKELTKWEQSNDNTE